MSDHRADLISSSLRKQLSSIENYISKKIGESDTNAEISLSEALKSSFQVVVDAGYTPDPSWNVAYLLKLESLVKNNEDERFFVNICENDDFRRLRDQRDRFMRSPFIEHIAPLANECFESLFQGVFKLPIPALLSMIEGVLFSQGSGIGTTNTWLIRQMNEMKGSWEDSSMRGLFWTGIQLRVERTWCEAKFDAPRPRIINRHFSQHGRDDTSKWRALDAYQLVDLLVMVSELKTFLGTDFEEL